MEKKDATKEKPFLNSLETYVPSAGRTKEDDIALTYNATQFLRKRRTHLVSNQFEKIYQDVMRHYTETEKYMYKQVQSGEMLPRDFEKSVRLYLNRYYGEQLKDGEDFEIMMDRINNAVFGLDVVQPLIDDNGTSDVKICGPNDIRVRVKGKAYQSNAVFYSNQDLYRFIEGLAIRNHIDILQYPVITFTDKRDPNYILRFTVSSPMVNAVDYPYLHIRKVPKIKPTFDELIEAGMLDEKIKLYLIDRAKEARCVVFAGPPGSGKTTALNAFIEYIPKTRETLVIQENDELYTEQSGFMFKHVTHGFQGEKVCTLEDLGKMALVEGCNEFIVGEVKGGEMRNVMTLLNAGGYASLTVHSTNAYETMDKLADLVKYGSTYSFDEARRMLQSIDTVVYMEGYKVREILEIDGYNDDTKQYNYVNIYRYNYKDEI